MQGPSARSRWTKAPSFSPGTRAGHSCVAIQSDLVVLGGFDIAAQETKVLALLSLNLRLQLMRNDSPLRSDAELGAFV
jgi:hypothetical protein